MPSRLDDIAIFVAIIDHGSFRAASHRLGLSPSVISKRLAALEQRLETQLLQRTTRKLNLTQAGELFYEQVRTIPQTLASAEEQLRESTGRVSGVLRVIMPTYFESDLLYEVVVPNYLTAHPEISLDLVLVANPLERLNEEFDLLVAGRLPNLRFPDSSAISRRLLRMQGALFASPDYLARHGKPTHPSELDDHNCLSYTNPNWHFTQPDGKPIVHIAQGSLRTNSNQLLRTATNAGLGITYSFPAFFGEDLDKGKVVRLLDAYTAGSFVEVHGFYPPSQYIPLRTRRFVDTLVTHLQSRANR